MRQSWFSKFSLIPFGFGFKISLVFVPVEPFDSVFSLQEVPLFNEFE